MNLWVGVIVGLVAAQRVAELAYAEHNTKRLKERGAVEIGAGHYPFIVVLHASWLIAVALAAPSDVTITWAWLIAFVVLQALRLWVLATLGPYWTTRIISLPGAPLVKKGPYRFVRHPNYLIVACEIAVLPLVFGEWRVAIVFSALNAAILAWRIYQEDKALDVRRGVSA